MNIRGLRQAGGFSLLEVSVIGVILMLFLAITFSRYSLIQAEAELTAKQAVESALHTAMMLQAAEIALRQGASHVASLAAQNPFALLEEKPANYRGEITANSAMEPGNWYYHPAKNTLSYARRWTDGRIPLPESRAVEQFRVKVRFGAGGVDGVVLEPMGIVER